MDLSARDMGPKKMVTWDMSILNKIGNKKNVKGQRHATLPLLKIDMQHQEPRQGPHAVGAPLYHPFYVLLF